MVVLHCTMQHVVCNESASYRVLCCIALHLPRYMQYNTTRERMQREVVSMNNDTPCLFYEDRMTPDRMISITQIQSFLSCRRKWKYGYVDGLHQRRERDYLTVGKLCHAGMEAAMRLRWHYAMDGIDLKLDDLTRVGQSAMCEMWERYMEVTDFLDEEIPEQRELLDRAVDVFEEALEELDPIQWMPVSIVKDGREEPALEVHFVIPCLGSSGLHGYIDAILTDQRTGQTWCVDYKFRRTLSDDDDEQFNLQNAVYMMACRHMGIDVAGSMTWQHYNSPSTVPKMNKDGSVSRSMIRCTWNRYRKFVESNGLDYMDYLDMEDKLASVEMSRTTREIRSDEMMDNIWDTIVEPTSMEIQDSVISGGGQIPSMNPWSCRMCSFQSLCQAELRGYDVEYIRNTEYTVKDYRK